MSAPDCRPRPHDLVWVDDVAAMIPVDAWPAWATPDWRAVAPAVVRRAPQRTAGLVPIGLRGATRSERCAAHAVASQITRTVTPEAVARQVAGRRGLADAPLPCLRTLARLAPSLDALPLPWGVTGSVGFTLASGFDVLRDASDLDLLVRAPDRRDAPALHAVAALIAEADGSVDVQVESARGAFTLGEWLRTGGPVLLKTAHGPVLCDDPWDPPTPA